MASRMAAGGATQRVTRRPSIWRSSSRSSGLVGSAVATVMVVESRAIGQAVEWRGGFGGGVGGTGGGGGGRGGGGERRAGWDAQAGGGAAPATGVVGCAGP